MFRVACFCVLFVSFFVAGSETMQQRACESFRVSQVSCQCRHFFRARGGHPKTHHDHESADSFFFSGHLACVFTLGLDVSCMSRMNHTNTPALWLKRVSVVGSDAKHRARFDGFLLFLVDNLIKVPDMQNKAKTSRTALPMLS